LVVRRAATADRKGAVAPVSDLVLEALSSRTRANDLGVKRDIYEHAGVREYWRVDPQESCVLVGTRIGPEIVDAPALANDDRLTSQLLPGFAVVVAELFRTAR
jgi:Uma2 family endonuclease